jgi:protein-disulfide isomerase
MASRTKQKEEARARRLAEERARAESSRRHRRTRMLAGVLVGAVIVVVVAIAVSSSGGGGSAPVSKAAFTQAAATVDSLLSGIPQSGNRLGSPTAPVVVTEFGDLECSHCQAFALGAEQTVISNDVRSGKVQLVFRSLETASNVAPNPNAFPLQQAAANAAGAQGKAWNYLLLFYHVQGQEGTGYVTQSFLDRIAQSIPGLNYSTWLSASANPTFTTQVATDEQLAKALGFDSTPSVTVRGPKGQAQPLIGAQPYAAIESEIKSVQ